MGARVRFYRGAYWVFINHRGQRRSRRIGTGESGKLAAREVAKRIAAKLALGESLTTEREIPTFESYCATWLARMRPRLKPSTYVSYEMLTRRELVPAFRGMNLDQVGRQRVKELTAGSLSSGHAPKSVQNTIRVLSCLFTHAKEDGLITENPALRPGLMLPKFSKRRSIHPLTREELSTVLDTARQHAPGYYPVLLCAARTGLRLGELIGLQWGDVDFQGRFLMVRRSVTRGDMTTPKSGEARFVDMSQELTRVLTDLRTERQLEAAASSWKEMPPWVFITETGARLDPDHLRKHVFYRLLAAAGVRQVRFHDLRHTFASLLLQNGESPAYVKEQMGHSSIAITVDLYGHLIPGGNRQAVDRLDGPIEKKNTEAGSANSF